MPHEELGSALRSTVTGLEDFTKGLITLPFEAGSEAVETTLEPAFKAFLATLVVIGVILVAREAAK